MTAEATFSPHWYRVAGLTPRLRPHVSVHRHRYRERAWYVLEDRATGKHHRVNHAAYQFVGLFNGERPVQMAWDLANERAGDEAPTQDQAIEMLSQLHQANLVEVDVNADFEVLLQRQKTSERRQRNQRFLNPLVVRIPLFDPDQLLDRIKPYADPLFSIAGALLWLAIVLSGVLLAGMHWGELRAQPLASLGEPANILLMVLVYPLIKILHELAHGLAIKRWGGEVHELGVALLVVFPVPYVDGKAAGVFASKWQRAAVASAGVAAELVIAVLALVLWLNVADGLLRDMLFSAMLIASVSTLFFNGNPLMRFDAYYVLADLVEIPDLWKRSREYWARLFGRIFAGRYSQTPMTLADERERAWLLGYGALSWSYWIVILFGLVLFASSLSPVAGFLLAAWAVATVLLLPLYRGVNKLRSHSHGGRAGLRASAIVLSGGALLLGALFLLPVAQYSSIQGVVWTPENARVIAGDECLVQEVRVRDGQWVSQGEVLLRCDSTELDARIRELEAEAREVRALIDGFLLDDRVKRRVASEKLLATREELRSRREQKSRMTVAAATSGRFYSARGYLDVGVFHAQGALIGHVLKQDHRTVTAVIEQDAIGLFGPKGGQAPLVRLHGDLGRVIEAASFRVLPGAVQRLPSPALAVPNGGPIAVMQDGGEELLALRPVYLVEVDVPAEGDDYRVGERATLRFEHAPVPIGQQWIRSLRQLFLGATTL